MAAVMMRAMSSAVAAAASAVAPRAGAGAVRSASSSTASCAAAAAAAAVTAKAAATPVVGTPVPPPVTTPPPPKAALRSHFKRASNIMASVNAEAQHRLTARLAGFRAPLPAFNVGDAVELTYVAEHSETNPVPIRGTVMAKRNRGIDSKFTIINSWDDEWYTATYTYASPLLRGMKIMMRNRHSDGLKRARRAKLTYLFGRDPKTFLVDVNTKELSEIQKEKEERRELQRQGKVYKKVRPGALKAAAKAAAAKKGGAKGGKGGGGAAAAAPAKAAPAKK